VLVFYDSVTHEFLDIQGAGCKKFYDFTADDFQVSAAGVEGWTKKDTSAVGTTVEAILANQSGGVMQLALDATNEKQEAGIYFGDALNFNIDKGVVFEARAAVHTAPTGQSEIYFGLANAYVEGPIVEADAGPTIHAFFCYDAALTPTIHTDDTSNDNDAVSTGVTSVLDTYEIFRIEILDPTDVKCYIDGTRVGSATTLDMSTGANVVLQPYLFCHKETGTGLGDFYVDYVKVWQIAR
jgi:hypothetical protein